MAAPPEPPSARNIDAWRDHAMAYLREQWAEDAPTALEAPAIFPHSPLAGEGPVAVFPFSTTRGPEGPQRFYVVVGHTEPNYYPAYDLDPDQLFCLHLGTRFMLVLGVAQCPPPSDYDPHEDARAILDRIAPDRALKDVQLAACFDVHGARHVVLKAAIADLPVYIMAGDAPHGFSQRADLPPQVAYRIHLGHVLLNEPDPDLERTPAAPPPQ